MDRTVEADKLEALLWQSAQIVADDTQPALRPLLALASEALAGARTALYRVGPGDSLLLLEGDAAPALRARACDCLATGRRATATPLLPATATPRRPATAAPLGPATATPRGPAAYARPREETP